MAETSEYKQWLSTAITNRAVVETIEIKHPDFATVRLANWDRDLIATLEDASVVTFSAFRFIAEYAETSLSTEQSTTLVISNIGGLLYQSIKNLTMDQRQSEITITSRNFFSDDPSQPLINPPPVWTLHNVSADMTSVRGELRSTLLRVRKSGIYFTTLEFPVLAYTS